jgi:hypothetical protein
MLERGRRRRSRFIHHVQSISPSPCTSTSMQPCPTTYLREDYNQPLSLPHPPHSIHSKYPSAPSEIHHISPDIYNTVDELILARFITQNPCMKVWITKFLSHLLPTEQTKHWYDHDVVPACPHCHNEEDTFPHQLQCSSNSSKR